MTTITNPVLEQMHAHQSIRAFTDEAVSDEAVAAIISAATSGPNMNNVQPVTFIEVTDQAIKASITEIVGMKYIETAARFFVIAVDYNKALVGADETTKAKIEDNLGYYANLEGAVVSAGIALGYALLAAESIGLGGVTMGGAMKAFELYEEKLQLPKYVKAVMGFSIGHPNQNPGVKPKLPVEGGFWMKGAYQQEALESAVSDYNQTMRAYFESRGLDKDWTEHTQKMMATPRDASALTQYAKDKGFNLK